MQYEIKGGTLPVVECYLEQKEAMWCEGGAMTWMSPNMEMKTQGGGFGGAISKLFAGEKMFSNTYTAVGSNGMIAFGSSFPGSIIAVQVTPGHDIICQKSAFLAATMGVSMSIFFQKKMGAGFFGGEGFIMQRISGNGTVFLEIDGSTVEKVLAPGEKLIVDTGYLAMIDSSVSLDVVAVKGVKNAMLGGEGLFNTEVTGPGRVVLQTMPVSAVAGIIAPFIPTGK